MVLNITFNVLSPDDWVFVVRLKELRYIVSPCFNHLKPLLAEGNWQVPLDCGNGGSGKVVLKDTKCRDSLLAQY